MTTFETVGRAEGVPRRAGVHDLRGRMRLGLATEQQEPERDAILTDLYGQKLREPSICSV